MSQDYTLAALLESGRFSLHRGIKHMIYCDKKLLTYEEQKNYLAAIAYLEKQYSMKNSFDILLALFADSWCYFNMPDICQSASMEIYGKWKQYTDIIITKQFDDFARYVVGYVLCLHGFYFGAKYEQTGREILSECAKQSSDECIKKLAESFIANEKKYAAKKYPSYDLSDCLKLFPSESLLDRYFRRIIMMSGSE